MAIWDIFKSNKNNKLINESVVQNQQYQNNSEDYNNHRLGLFQNLQDDIAIALSQRAITTTEDTTRFITNPVFQSVVNNMGVFPIASNKKERIKQYRSMSMFHECNWCIEEICDDFIHEDAEGKFIKLNLPQNKSNLNSIRLSVIQEEFDRFLDLFDFKNEGFNMIKRFLIEGELAFENIINDNYPDKGIVAVKFLPAEYYETLMDQRTGQRVGIFFDTESFSEDIHQVLSQSYLGSQQIFNSMLTTSINGFNSENCIPLLWPQVTYIDSGDFSADGLICYSILERVKQPYHQLSLLKDAAVILRVTRAPERLLFNVSTGKMNQNYANNYVRNFANELKSKKVVNQIGPNGKPDIASTYNPVTMLESYVFGKSEANDGTTVESVGSSANYEQVEDIEFFMRALLKAFKIPFSRWKVPENVAERDESISYEEYSFMRMVIRQQRRFAEGIRKAFIIDLKLRGMWDRFELDTSDIDIVFNPPVLYDQYQIQKALQLKMDMYSSVVSNEELSKTMAMKKILGWTDEEIQANFDALINEKMQVALGDYYVDQLNNDGPATYAPPIPIKGHEDAFKASDGDEEEEEGDGGEADDTSDETATDDTSEDTGDEGGEDSGGGFGLG